jgi:hypothetical protein
MTVDRWLPADGDVHVRIWLADMVFDYSLAVSAVGGVIHDWQRSHWCTMEFISDTVEDRARLPRLPCERLFLAP